MGRQKRNEITEILIDKANNDDVDKATANLMPITFAHVKGKSNYFLLASNSLTYSLGKVHLPSSIS